MLERVFHLQENQTTVRRELLAGLTTFMTMGYIVVVNPQILSETGMPVEGVLFATCLSAAVATLIMGLWANYPIALAPGMSLNAYFTYSIVLGRGVPWQTALGVVFLSGVVFLLLTLTSVREQIVNGIPDCLKHGTAAGIGLFIAFIGLRNAKIIVANSATFVGLGKASDPHVLLAALGVILTAILMVRRVGSAILLGIVLIALAFPRLVLSSMSTILESTFARSRTGFREISEQPLATMTILTNWFSSGKFSDSTTLIKWERLSDRSLAQIPIVNLQA